MKSKLFTMMFMLLYGINMLHAQAKQITGQVTDGTGLAVIGATVQIKGTDKGVITDFDGNYVLPDVEKTNTLMYSYLGMKTQEELVGDRTVINVVLKEDSEELDEVVVIGYGTTTKRKLVGSVSSIGSEQLEGTTFPNVQTALQGQVPGLVINSSGGATGDTPSISIRGGGEPLFVIDGIVADVDAFTMLNPEDVESMSFLKDASATAVYGSRAGDGIVLVETKKGKEGSPRINYSTNLSLGQPTVIADRLDAFEYVAMANEIRMRDEGIPYYTQDQIDQIGKSVIYGNNDWYDLIMRDNTTEQKHNLSVNGGKGNTGYFISLSNYRNNGMLYDDAEKLGRTTFRSNVNTFIEKLQLKVQTGMNFSVQDKRKPYSMKFDKLYDIAPMTPGYNPDGTLNNSDLNPVQYFTKDAGYQKYRNSYFNAQMTLTWMPKQIKGFTVGASGNYRNYSYFDRQWNRKPDMYAWDEETQTSTLTPPKEKPSMSSKSGYNRALDLEARVSYARSFGNHTVDALALYTQRETFSDYVMAGRKDYSSSSIDQINVGPLTGMTSAGTSAEGGSAGMVFRAKYDYASKYIVEVSGRYDGNDNFAPGHRWGFFPAVSGVWIMSDEAFMQGLNEKNILNLLKLRASHGKTGISNGVSRFGYESFYNVEGWSPNFYTIGGSPIAGFNEGALVDPSSLSWYTRTSTNVGFDFATLNNRLEGSVDYFYYETEGYLCSPGNIYSETLGTKLPQIRSNTLHRRAGYEFNLRYKQRFNDWYLELGGNASYFNQLYEQLDTENLATLQNPYTRKTHQKDYFADMYLSTGIYQNYESVLNSARPAASTVTRPGDLGYVDANGDGQIDENDERRINVPIDPHFNYGAYFRVSYKNWSLYGLFQGTGNRYTYLGHKFTGGTIARTLFKEQMDFWTPDNTDARYPNVYSTEGVNGYNNSKVSDHYIENVKYLRLKNLQLTYNLKNSLLKNVKFIEGLSLTLTGTNLFTISDVADFMDPESALVNTSELGDIWTAPNSGMPMRRTYTFGLNVQF